MSAPPPAVYVAASAVEINRAARAVSMLESAGLRVVSTWIPVIAAHGVSNPRNASAVLRRTWSVADLAELQSSDVLWFLAPATTRPTRGAWVEFGVAHAMGKHLVSSGDTAQSIFCALGEEHSTDQLALAAIVAWAQQRAVRVPRLLEAPGA